MVVDGRGFGFEIPERQVVEDTMKRTHKLEQRIESNKKKATRETERQAKRN